MKRFFNWQVMFGLLLISLSAVIYYIHYLLFRDLHNIVFYLISNLAFVFIQVLLVTLVLEEFLVYREKKAMLNKLNMAIGTFFSEVGTELLKRVSAFDKDASQITQQLVITNDWSNQDFLKILKIVKSHNCDIDSRRGNLESLKDFMKGKRQFLLVLLENPNLLEHESFTNLLWATFHLTDELVQRSRLTGLPDADYKHLAGDINRVYNLLITEWLQYMEHLKNKYPYLFSLAMRTNPFDAAASVELK